MGGCDSSSWVPPAAHTRTRWLASSVILLAISPRQPSANSRRSTRHSMGEGRHTCGCQCISLRSVCPPCTNSSWGGRLSGARALDSGARAASSSAQHSTAQRSARHGQHGTVCAHIQLAVRNFSRQQMVGACRLLMRMVWPLQLASPPSTLALTQRCPPTPSTQ